MCDKTEFPEDGLEMIVRNLANQARILVQHGLFHLLGYNIWLLRLWSRSRRALKASYVQMDKESLRASRKSHRVYVFGSGYSLNELTEAEWECISQHDTVGFNAFIYQDWVRTDFHLVRGWGEGANVHYAWEKEVGELAKVMDRSCRYRETVLLLQDEYFAEVSRILVGEEMLKHGRRIGLYKTARNKTYPTASIDDGLTHLSGTLTDAVNLAFCLGWKEIILVGVDLYDTRYFWLQSDETIFTESSTGERRRSKVSDRGQRFNESHSTVTNGVVREMKVWRQFMKERGVDLYVYNPKSLLAEVLPVYGKVR